MQHASCVAGGPEQRPFLPVHDLGHRRVDREAQVANELKQHPETLLPERRLERVGRDPLSDDRLRR